jgi:hypothetical protein
VNSPDDHRLELKIEKERDGMRGGNARGIGWRPGWSESEGSDQPWP